MRDAKMTPTPICIQFPTPTLVAYQRRLRLFGAVQGVLCGGDNGVEGGIYHVDAL